MQVNDFKQIGKVFAARSIERLIASAEAGNIDAINNLIAVDIGQIPKDQRVKTAKALYSHSKTKLAAQDLNESLKVLKKAHHVDPQNQLYSARTDLLQRMILFRKSVRWRVSLDDLQRDLKLLCNKSQCGCQSHYQIATCKGLLDENFSYKETMLDAVVVYTLGPYYSRSYSGGWTKLLKAIKHPPHQSDPLKPMAHIVADFIAERTLLLKDIDVIVPVPGSNPKVKERKFAPNVIVAAELGNRLGLPVRHALRRRDGPDTHEASNSELARQFEADESEEKYLKNLTILLVEDIWTQGRTLPICAEKLQTLQPKSIYAVALAKTSG